MAEPTQPGGEERVFGFDRDGKTVSVVKGEEEALRSIGGRVAAPEELEEIQQRRASKALDAAEASEQAEMRDGYASGKLGIGDLIGRAATKSAGQLGTTFGAFAGGAGVLAPLAPLAGRKAEAFAEGATDAVTLGTGKLVAKGVAGALGGAEGIKREQDRRALLEQAEGGAKGVGMLAGIVTQTIATGGAGGAKGLAGILNPSALAGEAAEQAAVRVLGTTAAKGALGKALATAGSVGVRGAVEGAIMSGATEVTDDMFADRELAGEKVLAAMGHGALFGGLTGAGLGFTGSLAGSAKDAAGRGVGRLLGGAKGAAVEAAEKVAGAADDVAAKADRAVAGVAGEVERGAQLAAKGAEAGAEASSKAASELVGGGAEKMLTRESKEAGVRSLGGTRVDYRKAEAKLGREGVEELGEYVQREFLTPAVKEKGLVRGVMDSTPEALLPKLEERQMSVGRRIGDILDQSNQTVKLSDLFRDADDLVREAGKDVGKLRAARALRATMEDFAQSLENAGLIKRPTGAAAAEARELRGLAKAEGSSVRQFSREQVKVAKKVEQASSVLQQHEQRIESIREKLAKLGDAPAPEIRGGRRIIDQSPAGTKRFRLEKELAGAEKLQQKSASVLNELQNEQRALETALADRATAASRAEEQAMALGQQAGEEASRTPWGLSGDDVEIPLSELARQRRSLAKLSYEQGTAGAGSSKELHQFWERRIEQRIMDGVDRAAESGFADAAAYRAVKREYQLVTTAKDIAETGVERAKGNNRFGLIDTLGAVGGMASGGLAGGLAVGAATSVVRKYGDAAAAVFLQRAAESGSVVRAVQRVDASVQRAARGIVDGSVKVERAAATRKAVDPRPRARQAIQRVMAMKRDPMAYAERLQNSTASLQNAPEVGLGYQTAAMRASTFLAEKMPHSNREPDPLRPERDELPISKQEAASFLRYVDAVQNPEATFEEIARGKVTREAVEAFRVVYPKLYSQLQTKTMDRLAHAAKSGKPVPFSTRVRVGVLLGAPTDPSLRPSTTVWLQSNTKGVESNEAGSGAPQGAAPAGPRRPISVNVSTQQTSLDRVE